MCLALGVAMAEGAEDETYVGRVGAAVAERSGRRDGEDCVPWVDV